MAPARWTRRSGPRRFCFLGSPSKTPGTRRPRKPRGTGGSFHRGRQYLGPKCRTLPGGLGDQSRCPPWPPSASVPRDWTAPSARRRSEAPAPSLSLSPRPGAHRKAAPGPAANPAPWRAAPRRVSVGPAARTHHTKSPSRRLTAAILPPNHRRRTGRREQAGRLGAAHWSGSDHVMGAGCHRPRRCSDVTAPVGDHWPVERHVTRAPRSPRAEAQRLPALSPSLRLVTTKRPRSEAAAAAATVRPAEREREPASRPAPPPGLGLRAPPLSALPLRPLVLRGPRGHSRARGAGRPRRCARELP